MKIVLKFVVLLFVVVLMSCRDTKKEDLENQEALEEIESVETTINEASQELDEDLKELEDALKELDSI
jgi:septal ring factor EnvC (AmiA/AmiB activator)